MSVLFAVSMRFSWHFYEWMNFSDTISVVASHVDKTLNHFPTSLNLIFHQDVLPLLGSILLKNAVYLVIAKNAI